MPTRPLQTKHACTQKHLQTRAILQPKNVCKHEPRHLRRESEALALPPPARWEAGSTNENVNDVFENVSDVLACTSCSHALNHGPYARLSANKNVAANEKVQTSKIPTYKVIRATRPPPSRPLGGGINERERPVCEQERGCCEREGPSVCTRE